VKLEEAVSRLRQRLTPVPELVYGYAAVDASIVRDVVENHTGDLLDFAAAIRARLPG
jgi:uncharacterized protein YutE (UPF0331/DUF86 family)